MIVLKIGFIILRLCEKDKLDEVCEEIKRELDDEKLMDIAVELFNNKKIELTTIASIDVPSNALNDHVDTFFKAIRTAQEMKKSIIIVEQPHFISHTGENQ